MGASHAIIWSYNDCVECVPLTSTESPFTFHDQVAFLLGLRKDWKKIVTHGFGGEYGHPQHRAVHDVVVAVARTLHLLPRVWCIHPLRWHENWLNGDGKTFAQLERIDLMDFAYPSQKAVWTWLINLETSFVPYVEHVSNMSALAIGCQHSMRVNAATAVFRWFCLSWCGK